MVFRGGIERDGHMYLTGMLGAEAGGLPLEVVEDIETFFRWGIDDLSMQIGGPDAVARAFHVTAALVEVHEAQFGHARSESLTVFGHHRPRGIERRGRLRRRPILPVFEQRHSALASVSAYADDCT